ncbi:MAG: CHAT domain-containing protein, partial [bacterium]|nr:CHAT domain-containing protein [bacterium]
MAVVANVEIQLQKENTCKITWHQTGDFFHAQAPDLGQGENLWPDARKALETGHTLFQLLDGDARHLSRLLSEAEAEGNTLELRIATCPKSSDWPLELLAKDHEFLLRSKLHLVRTIRPGETAAQNPPNLPKPPKRPLKLLFMVGSPMDVTPLLDFEKEEEAIFKVTEKRAVDLEVEDSGTLEGLQERLLLEKYDVVHLAGHANIRKNGQPYFILENETGHRRDVTCDVLWNEALTENPPQMLFLSGCRTGQAGPSGQPGLAGETMETGVGSFARLMVSHFKVPAVLGWGRSVHDDLASVAAECIYRYLCLGRSLVEAVQRARVVLMDRFGERKGQAWPLLRLFCKSKPPAALVATGQKASNLKPRKLKHTYLKNSEVKILAEGFIGRRRQLQQCLRVLKEEDDKIGVLLQGTGGLGKSCLAGKLCERFSNHHLIVVHGVLNDVSLGKALDLAFTMAQDGQGLEILGQQKEMTEKLKALCATSFANKNYFFILDDFEQNLESAAKDDPWRLTVGAAGLLTVLLYLLRLAGKATQMIITCRYGFSLTVDGRDLVKQCVQAVTLSGFLHGEQLKKGRELSHINNYPVAETKMKLLAAGCGNPRLMEWLDVLVGQMAQAEVPVLLAAVADKQQKYIRDHVLRELLEKGGSGMTGLLEVLSIYRVPVEMEGVLSMGRSMGLKDAKTRELLEKGVDLSVVERNSARGTFQVTPLLREELLAAVTEQKSRHRAAYGYFQQVCDAQLEKEKFDAVLVEELVYHALACGEEEAAARWGGGLVKHLGESLAFGESRRVGEWVLAEKKQPLANEHDAFLLNAIGYTVDDMGDYPKAIEYYEQQLEIYKKCFGEKHQNTAVTLNNLGMAWDALGDLPKAIEYYEQALK